MLSVLLLPKQGNSSGGHFPHTGHLGVTPVHLAGTCVTKLEEGSDLLPTRSISIRVQCCEQRLGGPFSSQPERVLWEKTKTLWSASPDTYEPLGYSERPFRLSIPPSAALAAVNGGLGAGSQVMREWRIVWKLEAIVEFKPITFVGHRATRAYTLDLHDHRVPSVPPTSPPSELVAGSGSTSIEFLLTQPRAAYGPGDSIDLELGVRPLDVSTTVRRVSFVLERRLELYDEKSPTRSTNPTREPSPSPSPGGPDDSTSSNSPPPSTSPQPRSRISAIFSRGLSPRPSYARLPDSTSPPPEGSSESKRHFSIRIAEASCDDPSPGPDGVTCPSARILLPKRGGRWDVGHSVRTRLAAVSFEIRVKVSLRVKGHKVVREIAGPVIPVIIVGTTSMERAAASTAASVLASNAVSASTVVEATVALPLAKNADGEVVNVTSSALTATVASSEGELTPKVKRRHKSTRRGLYMHEGTVDISDPVVSGGLPHRRKTKSSRSISNSPVGQSPPELAHTPIAVVVEDAQLKPILLPAEHAAQSKPIHFVFPSPPPHGNDELRRLSDKGDAANRGHGRGAEMPSSYSTEAIHGDMGKRSNVTLPPIQSILPYPTPSNSASSLSPQSTEAIDYDSLSILRQFQQTGRRISTTTSEEEEVQPSRSRQRLSMADSTPVFQPLYGLKNTPSMMPTSSSSSSQHTPLLSPPQSSAGIKTRPVSMAPGPGNGRPALPSLDALGLGLPQIPDEDNRPPSRRRPRTAPSFGVYSGPSVPPRPLGSLGSLGCTSTASVIPMAETAGPRPLTSMASLPGHQTGNMGSGGGRGVVAVNDLHTGSHDRIPRQPPQDQHQPFAFAVQEPDDPTPVATPIIAQRP